MARPAPKASIAEEFTEKTFYLDEFRGHTLILAARAARLASRGAIDHLAAVARDLLPNDTRLVILVDAESGEHASRTLRSIQRRLVGPVFGGSAASPRSVTSGRGRRAGAFVVLPTDAGMCDVATLTTIWNALRQARLFIGVIPCASTSLADCAQQLGARLRVHKLVLLEDEGGVSDGAGRQISFMDATMLGALLGEGEAEWTGVAHRRATLEAVRKALHAGVTAVNLCSLEGLGRELFTYEGSGTLFTLEDYCRVAPLGIDDFEEVQRLIERGQREGVLKSRSPEEIAELVVCGYGATIGAHHLAGMCALYTEPYRAERAGEVVALYTVTRFKGEGVGRKLLAHVEAEALQQGLRYLFACTTQLRAETLFRRNGFARVTAADVPAAKWKSYDPDRLEQVAVYRRDLPASGASPEAARRGEKRGARR